MSLQDTFLAFCRFGDKNNPGQMDNKKFAKLCKDAKIVDKAVTNTDVDLIFTKIKGKGQRKIGFDQFKEGLAQLAAKKYPKAASKEEAYDKIATLVTSANPEAKGVTKADKVRLHDDKSGYTGVYAQGGPTTVDGKITLSNLADRSSADARGVKVSGGPASARKASVTKQPAEIAQSARKASTSAKPAESTDVAAAVGLSAAAKRPATAGRRAAPAAEAAPAATEPAAATLASAPVAGGKPVAVVTGTNSGVGLELSVLLGKDHTVYAGMRSLDKKEDLVKAATAAGVADSVIPIVLDVNSDESVKAAFDDILSKHEAVDVLVANDGDAAFGSVEMLSMEAVAEQFNANLYGVVRCQKAVLPGMRKKKKGKIVGVSSVGGVHGQPFNDIYCASKFAMEGLFESQAGLFREFGVRVSLVEPDLRRIGHSLAGVPEEYKAALAATEAAYKEGSTSQTPQEVAQSIVNKVINTESPPLRVQTNDKILDTFNTILKDLTGESTVAMQAKFMPKKA